MIKLPLNISNSNQKSWHDCLTQARDRRVELAKLAEKYYRSAGRLIRPIVLVQAERTGKHQRDVGLVHSEAVKEHLMERLDVPASAIAIKTSEKDDIEGIDLMAEDCPVEWIITKAALQEGWDCPFAYILVSLNNTGRQQTMTQLVGRVLRQPDAERTPLDELNQSYVFCLRRRASEIAQQVKKALEQEGYEGGLMSAVDRSDTGGKPDGQREAAMRPKFRRFYKEFEGTVYLPRFCIRRNGSYEPLDYFRHLIGEVNVTAFDYASPDWDFSRELEAARDAYYRITLGEEMETVRQESAAAAETDEQVKQWLVASLDFDYYSYKQLREIVERATRELLKRAPELQLQLSLVKFPLRSRITGLIERQTDQQTQTVFETLYKKKSLCFYLECREARFEIPPKVSIRATKCLVQEDNAPLQRSLFDCVADDLNWTGPHF